MSPYKAFKYVPPRRLTKTLTVRYWPLAALGTRIEIESAVSRKADANKRKKIRH